jgi:hypothetical protein
VSPLHAVTLSTPLTTALGMLLEAGVSGLLGAGVRRRSNGLSLVGSGGVLR